jgi:hypothetical protein
MTWTGNLLLPPLQMPRTKHIFLSFSLTCMSPEQDTQISKAHVRKLVFIVYPSKL